jgi:hypothetical protein
MSSQDVVSFLILWSTIGSVLFSIYVVVAFRTGIVYSARKDDGTLKERIPLNGYINMALFLFVIIGYFMVANYLGVKNRGFDINFKSLLLLNYLLYLILFIYDTLVIDGLVLGVWRPKFLRLREGIGSESMMKHILISIPVGAIFGLVLMVLAAGISYIILFNS